MSEFHVAARVKLKEGFDMSRLKMELANGLEKDYLLKNIDLEDDITEPGKAAAQIEQPTHILTYELSGEITQKQILTGLEQTRDKLGSFDIEGLNIED